MKYPSSLILTCRRFGIFCCLLLLVGCQSTSPPQGVTLKVARVVSGQGLEVLDSSKQSALTERVRLIGVEAPDLKQRPWGPKARDKLEQLIGRGTVLLESDEETQDQYGRRLAYLWQDGVLLNEQMVVQGYALFVPRSPNNKYDQRLAHAQEVARVMERGIWDRAQPMRLSPDEFRRLYR